MNHPKNLQIAVLLLLGAVLVLPVDLAAGAKKGSWEEVFCIGGDALDGVDLRVEFASKEDVAQLTIETGGASEQKNNLVRKFTAHLEKGSFKRMVQRGRIEITLSSEAFPLTASGGETSHAALLELTRNAQGDFTGYVALEGSVFEISCPKDPRKYFAPKDSGRA